MTNRIFSTIGGHFLTMAIDRQGAELIHDALDILQPDDEACDAQRETLANRLFAVLNPDLCGAQPAERGAVADPAAMRLVLAAETLLKAYGGDVPDWLRDEAAELGKALEPYADEVDETAPKPGIFNRPGEIEAIAAASEEFDLEADPRCGSRSSDAYDEETLREAAEAIIHQRDFNAEHGHYDASQPNPNAEPDQCFDDWAADILSQALKA